VSFSTGSYLHSDPEQAPWAFRHPESTEQVPMIKDLLARRHVFEGKLHTLHGTASGEAGKPCSEEPNEDGHPRRTHYIT
jgi:hypothetical protein